MNYKIIKGAKGNRFMRDGKFVKKSEVPEEIISQLESGEEVKHKPCIFCGKEANHQRFVLLQLVDLCYDHYYSETMGKVANKVRELQNA